MQTTLLHLSFSCFSPSILWMDPLISHFSFHPFSTPPSLNFQLELPQIINLNNNLSPSPELKTKLATSIVHTLSSTIFYFILIPPLTKKKELFSSPKVFMLVYTQENLLVHTLFPILSLLSH